MVSKNNHPDIEDIILSYSGRGIELLRQELATNYCSLGADLILKNKGIIIIGTGFPVGNTFESDGPVGAICLYNTLKYLNYQPVFVCASPLAKVLKIKYTTFEIPIQSWKDSIPIVKNALKTIQPALIISIERPGITADGHYYNFKQKDITNHVAKFDLFFKLCQCPTLAIGDGGNEIGMGNISQALKQLPIIPSITKCTQLIIATVSNWGVYGLITALKIKTRQNLFNCFQPEEIINFLLQHGCIDGITQSNQATEDGFPLDTGLQILDQLKSIS